ncbi:hypothetical protein SLS62_008468 [Diatrype stigma]|uniref:YebC-like protein n=1 Tax=Diatrype stigma TaxID=117547 RepID=A0AAN9YL07_9PEZI
MIAKWQPLSSPSLDSAQPYEYRDPPGHNRWSKIKHEKGAADKKKNAQRTTFANHLTLYSKLYGADPSLNSQLASVITAAKKAGMPKANIDIAIARGQGKSSTGQGLESATLEAMLPPPTSAAMVIDIETDNKQRSLKDLRSIIKDFGANVAPTSYLFRRLGRTVLRLKNSDGDSKKGVGGAGEGEGAGEMDFDDVFMQALDAGAEDVEQDEDGNVVIWTQPSAIHQVAHKLTAALGTEILSQDIIYSPTADKVKVDDAEAAKVLRACLAAVRDYPDVQAMYTNLERGEVDEELWDSIEESLEL